MATGEAPTQLDLRALDAHVRVLTDGSSLVRRIRDELGAFLVHTAASADAHEVEIRFAPPPPRARLDSTVLELEEDQADEQAYALLFRTLLDRIDTHMLLHAATVERDNHGIVVAGPTHAGKTTIALSLMRRGFRLLSDDFSPLDRTTGLIRPFFKALGVRPGPSRALANLHPSAAGDDARHALGATRFPPEQLADTPVRPAGVLLLDGGNSPPSPKAPYRFAIRAAGPASPIAGAVDPIAGVEVEGVEEDLLVLSIDPEHCDAKQLAELLETPPTAIVEYGALPRRGTRPSGEARIERVEPYDALLLLVRDVQNRRPGGALMHSVSGDPAKLFLEAAAHLGHAKIGWLVPGSVESTAEVVEAWADQAVSSPSNS